MRKLRTIGSGEDDPLDGVANFFDLGVIFALGFMVPLMVRLAQPSGKAAESSSAKVAQNQALPLDRYRPTNDQLGGEGERLGVAYRLKSGEVVYVPEPDRKRLKRDGLTAQTVPLQWSHGESNPDLLNAIQPSSR